ncbi:hypothetical protein Tco_0757441 [Tanacetum coccineum]
MAYSNQLNTTYRLSDTVADSILSKCMTRSSYKDLVQPFENPEHILQSTRKLNRTTRLDSSSFLYLDVTADPEDHKDPNEHIKNILKIADLFHISDTNINQIMLRAFPMSLTGAERFNELLLKCPQHYLTDMQEVIAFYKGLDAPTRQILDSHRAIPTMKVVEAKKAIHEMADYS